MPRLPSRNLTNSPNEPRSQRSAQGLMPRISRSTWLRRAASEAARSRSPSLRPCSARGPRTAARPGRSCFSAPLAVLGRLTPFGAISISACNRCIVLSKPSDTSKRLLLYLDRRTSCRALIFVVSWNQGLSLLVTLITSGWLMSDGSLTGIGAASGEVRQQDRRSARVKPRQEVRRPGQTHGTNSIVLRGMFTG